MTNRITTVDAPDGLLVLIKTLIKTIVNARPSISPEFLLRSICNTRIFIMYFKPCVKYGNIIFEINVVFLGLNV